MSPVIVMLCNGLSKTYCKISCISLEIDAHIFFQNQEGRLIHELNKLTSTILSCENSALGSYEGSAYSRDFILDLKITNVAYFLLEEQPLF